MSERTGLSLIAAECVRTAIEEGFTPDHDDTLTGGELAMAASCYAVPPACRPFPVRRSGQAPLLWPGSPKDWKPGDRIRELVKAGALIAAEIDRILRTQ